MLKSLGEVDVDISVAANGFPINLETGHDHPFASANNYKQWKSGISIACPLPRKISSLYNIVTPMNLYAWIAVILSTVVMALAFVVQNQVYSKMSQISCFWRW